MVGQAPRCYQDASLYNIRHNNIIVANNDDQMALPASLPQRPKNFNQYGKAATVIINTFNVLKMPNSIVYQYDVSCPVFQVLNCY